jgi:hypothetical protein
VGAEEEVTTSTGERVRRPGATVSWTLIGIGLGLLGLATLLYGLETLALAAFYGPFDLLGIGICLLGLDAVVAGLFVFLRRKRASRALA